MHSFLLARSTVRRVVRFLVGLQTFGENNLTILTRFHGRILGEFCSISRR